MNDEHYFDNETDSSSDSEPEKGKPLKILKRPSGLVSGHPINPPKGKRLCSKSDRPSGRPDKHEQGNF